MVSILALVAGGLGPAVFAAALSLGILVLTRSCSPSVDALRVSTRLIFALHAIVAIVTYAALLHFRGTATAFVDDISYDRVARAVAESLHGTGPGVSSSDLYLVNPWDVVLGAMYALVGPSVLIGGLLNAGFLAISAQLMGATVRHWASPAAGVATAWGIGLFPSLTLWAALALKDASAILLLAIVIWAVGNFVRSERWWWAVVLAIALVLLDETRRYLFLVLAVAIPPALLGMSRSVWPKRVIFSAAAVVLSAGIGYLTTTQSLGDALALLPSTRANMAVGARTAFVTPAPQIIAATEGSAFQLRLASAPASAGGVATPRPTTVVVRPGTRLVIGISSPPQVAGQPPTVAVQPNDTVIVSTRRDATAPPSPTSIIVVSGTQVVVSNAGDAEIADSSLALSANLAHLPIGALYVLGAPFPWAATSWSDALTVPDMLLWYVLVGLAVVGTSKLVQRGKWNATLVVLSALGVGAVLALIEGNTGTLFRHRAMLIPLVVALAAEPIVQLVGRFSSKLARERASANNASRSL